MEETIGAFCDLPTGPHTRAFLCLSGPVRPVLRHTILLRLAFAYDCRVQCGMNQSNTPSAPNTIAAAVARLQAQKAAMEVELSKVVNELADLEVTARMMRKYGIETPAEEDQAAPMRAVALKQLDRTISKRERILGVASEMLASGPLLTEALLAELGIRDITVSGDDRTSQIRNLSSYLSRAQAELGIKATRSGWTKVAEKGEDLINANGNSQGEVFSVQPSP